jgi:putative ABC transport system permease protein
MTLSTTRQHLRIAVRTLVRAPGFALGAALTLALGIGLSTAVFTVANTILLRPLPVRDQDRIVLLWGDKQDKGVANYPLSTTEARTFARETRVLERVGFALYQGALPISIREGDQVSRLRRGLVSGNFFDVLGVRPLLGRTLRASDDVVGAAPVVTISHGVWQRRFGGSADVIGRRLLFYDSNVSATIVGVMPQGLDFPKGADVWSPVFASIPEQSWQYLAFTPVGRLASGKTLANARDELTVFLKRPDVNRELRDSRGDGRLLPQQMVGETRAPLIAFAAAAGLLLLITCINVANLLLVRGLARVREIAVRSALGASRGTLIAHLLLENAVLALCGGALGVGIAAAAVRLFVAVAPGGTPRVNEIHLDLTAIAAAVVITLLATSIFAVAPSLFASKVDTVEALRAGARGGAGRRSRSLSEGLVVAQVAVAMIVLSAAGLITRSLIALERADLALDSKALLIAELSLRAGQYDDAAKQRVLLERVMARVQTLPGVRAASPMVAVPFSGPGGWDGRFMSEGQSASDAAKNPMLDIGIITPEYFATFGQPVVRGRGFTPEDREGAPPVVVITELTARYHWPGVDPIGKRFARDGSQPPLTVVGVVPDARYRDLREARASIYFPLRQSFFPFAPMVLAVRTSGDPVALAPALRAAVADVDPALAVASAAPFESFLNGPLGQPRLNALLLGIFAGSALILCAVGLLGVMLTMVRQRTRELGVRIALGATPRELSVMVLNRGLGIAGAGLFVGAVAAAMLNRGLAALLYAVSPWDTVTFAVVGALLVGMAAVASAVPARAVARIDPVAALRADG